MCVAIAIVLICSSATFAGELTTAQVNFFEKEVRPLLVGHCFKCHSGIDHKGGLRLDSRGHLLLGGESGPAIVPSAPEKSLLMEAIRYESYEMPPSKKLHDREIAVLETWIRQGAFWPGDDGSVARRDDPERFTAEDRAWWALQPLADPPIPTTAPQDRNENEIDAFIRHTLAKEQLRPATEADRRTLIRRLSFDLLGLPPTPEEVAEFLADDSPFAYERLVDRMLSRPEYGERWGRHWLDLVRYAESDGYNADLHRPQAWRYRDYVNQSFNNDKPYDQFVQEQLAGDELFPDDINAQVATGYLRHGVYEYNQRDVRLQWDMMLNEITDTTADVFLGLGLQCARCHDHKFDPLLQKDYYRLRAFFEPLVFVDDKIVASDAEIAAFQAQERRFKEAADVIQAELDELQAPYYRFLEKRTVKKFPEEIQQLIHKPKEERTPREEQLVQLAWRQVLFDYTRIDGRFKPDVKERVLELRRRLAALPVKPPVPLRRPMMATDVGPDSPPTLIPKRNVEVPPGFPTLMQEHPATIVAAEGSSLTSGRRSTLARWMTHPTNPLTPRVIVNRVWQYHFGKGLVENSSDFGRLGTPPTHPELLDWLTSRFLEDGWRLKSLHRRILTSATYRQSSRHSQFAEYQQRDPQNRWYWRADTRRLDAEQIRDAILAISGELDRSVGGPGVSGETPRRSIYLRSMRNTRDPLLDAFDLPLSFTSTASRNTTTSPVQSLLMFNSRTMLRFASIAANHAMQRTSENRAGQVAHIEELWQLAYGRLPNPTEMTDVLAYLSEKASDPESVTASLIPDLPIGKMAYRDGQSILVSPGSEIGLMSVPHTPDMKTGDFTIEAFFELRSVYENGSIRTLASKGGDGSRDRGWFWGVTGNGSGRKPQTLVLKIRGGSSRNALDDATLFSDQHIDTNKPYYAGVSVRLANDERPGTATFYLKDLSNDEEPLLIAKIPHNITGEIDSDSPLTFGSRKSGQSRFDGLIDEIRMSRAELSRDELLIAREEILAPTIGYWQFEPSPGILHDTASGDQNIELANSSNAEQQIDIRGLADLCHILLNSNEFLYID